MDYQQKAEALASLCDLAICFREVRNRIGINHPWYVSQNIDVKNGGCLEGKYGNGATPQEAVEDHWRALVSELPADQYLIIREGGSPRRAVRWNGFMWADVMEAKSA